MLFLKMSCILYNPLPLLNDGGSSWGSYQSHGLGKILHSIYTGTLPKPPLGWGQLVSCLVPKTQVHL